MRLIDADALRETLGITGTADTCHGCKYNEGYYYCNTEAAPRFAYVCECIDDAPTVDADKALRKAAMKLAYIHAQIDLYDDRPELHEEAYWLEYLVDEDWKDGQID